MRHKALWPLTKGANRGFRGHPLAIIAFYGPDDRRASKVAVGIVPAEGAAPTELKRWLADDHDIRDDVETASAISCNDDLAPPGPAGGRRFARR